VHNHFAKVPVPHGLFGPKVDEWVTEPDGKEGRIIAFPTKNEFGGCCCRPIDAREPPHTRKFPRVNAQDSKLGPIQP
jgi:hypothetical protein